MYIHNILCTYVNIKNKNKVSIKYYIIDIVKKKKGILDYQNRHDNIIVYNLYNIKI